MTKTKITVIGSGSWGTAIAILLAGKNENKVTLWTRREDFCKQLQNERENDKYLPGISFPENLSITSDLEKAVSKRDVLVFVVPSHSMRDIGSKVNDLIDNDPLILSASKGIEIDTLKPMSQVLADTLDNYNANTIATLSGPNHAEEVGKGIPSASVIACKKKIVAEKLQSIFITSRFRVYTNPDIVGVEMGGALKNIMALGSGISDGIGFGDNTKAAFMTRGVYEISRLGNKLGARSMTFAGLAGIGDLIVTCTSEHSRNRRAGKMIGKGMALEEITEGTNMVIEGFKTTKAANYLAQKTGTEMPITTEIYNILFNGKSPIEGVNHLMKRVKTDEMEEVVDTNMWRE
ncbi:NAD(P)H-dependent glycerol-3-phosphate dehydrogenase [Natranaerobius trueperi]|uniref:Glycerol-3-phosphate dehydrogenase [NAD(P)+] n=1 Tax=Natranaerobius trueperi TaxID=759412 RepID=A0A226BVD5_9FIRM|nr:NAD(P)H-dependent glycerol-3-phosphate dehydrogenase [Natranaerobius trueperi]OWZ82953.1 glycerol-3-phosphate dehydrogenase [Natranaerobius trueperi]